jgi:hypothetical protein
MYLRYGSDQPDAQFSISSYKFKKFSRQIIALDANTSTENDECGMLNDESKPSSVGRISFSFIVHHFH